MGLMGRDQALFGVVGHDGVEQRVGSGEEIRLRRRKYGKRPTMVFHTKTYQVVTMVTMVHGTAAPQKTSEKSQRLVIYGVHRRQIS